jgi:excisionase family DNA binding protein
MDYITAQEAANHLQVSVRMVYVLLNNGRIKGAERGPGGSIWLIPKNPQRVRSLRGPRPRSLRDTDAVVA